MESPEISVYGEAKGEYTRQLTLFLLPCLESYFLELLDQAKEQSPTPQKYLWQFQNLLQAIPDWNQDKVIRETEKIQKDCTCDYLEELLTAVFIAHTKVLSAIRLTTKQKKLQITIPKIDHFLHRVLSDSARSLWTNAYLFADTASIEKQKNLRQVSNLLQEAILQAIRGLLPVKSILREYLHDEGGKEDDEEEVAPAPTPAPPTTPVEEETLAAPLTEEKVEESEEETKPEAEISPPPAPSVEEEVAAPAPAALPMPHPESAVSSDISGAAVAPMIYIDTKPSVSFANEHVFFDSDSLENNEIHDVPFAEAENREEEEEEGDADDDTIQITNEVLPMEADEILS
jgi:hypothetical protein